MARKKRVPGENGRPGVAHGLICPTNKKRAGNNQSKQRIRGRGRAVLNLPAAVEK